MRPAYVIYQNEDETFTCICSTDGKSATMTTEHDALGVVMSMPFGDPVPCDHLDWKDELRLMSAAFHVFGASGGSAPYMIAAVTHYLQHKAFNEPNPNVEEDWVEVTPFLYQWKYQPDVFFEKGKGLRLSGGRVFTDWNGCTYVSSRHSDVYFKGPVPKVQYYGKIATFIRTNLSCLFP
jgi:hypothetical protein